MFEKLQQYLRICVEHEPTLFSYNRQHSDKFDETVTVHKTYKQSNDIASKS